MALKRSLAKLKGDGTKLGAALVAVRIISLLAVISALIFVLFFPTHPEAGRINLGWTISMLVWIGGLLVSFILDRKLQARTRARGHSDGDSQE